MAIETIIQIAYMAVVTMGLIISLIANFKKRAGQKDHIKTEFMEDKLKKYVNQLWTNIMADCEENGVTYNAKELVKTAKSLINKFKK